MSSTYTPTIGPETVAYKSIEVDGLNIAYREAGNASNPKLVLLHGFPSSSHQYRNLIPALADRFHVIAPDYPGFGDSAYPDPDKFSYTFDKLAEVVEGFLEKKGFDRYGLYVQDYGGPVGFRIVTKNPSALEWLIIQNTNAYEIGFTAAWGSLRGDLWKERTPASEAAVAGLLALDTVKAIYLQGSTLPELISPDNWNSEVASVPERTSAEDNYLLGPRRYLLYSGRWGGLSSRSAESRDASAQCRTFRGRGLPRLHLQPHAHVLRGKGRTQGLNVRELTVP